MVKPNPPIEAEPALSTDPQSLIPEPLPQKGLMVRMVSSIGMGVAAPVV